MPLERLKKVLFLPLGRTTMKEMLIQDMMSLVIFGGNPKNLSVSLMKDHSSLSKAFSNFILRIMLASFLFILLKWESTLG